MGHTPESGRRNAANIKKKDPNHFKKAGAKGGAAGRTGGFFGKPEAARAAGKKSAEVRNRQVLENLDKAKTTPVVGWEGLESDPIIGNS